MRRIKVKWNLYRRLVSISDEKPLHMRRWKHIFYDQARVSFNLRREAAPHATLPDLRHPGHCPQFQSQTRSRSTCDVRQDGFCSDECYEFQSQTRSRSTCDHKRGSITAMRDLFQSQTRSRSTCDAGQRPVENHRLKRFNLRREAAPHATSTRMAG